MTAPPLARLALQRCSDGAALAAAERCVPEEAAVAFVIDGRNHAVMMATPADLEDFALGFCLNEGIVETASQLRSIDIVSRGDGVELRLAVAAPSLVPPRSEVPLERLTAPSGCGLCGVPCLTDALRPLRFVRAPRSRMTRSQVAQAMAALVEGQRMNHEARAMHAAAFWHPHEGLVALREDVGRHCALDKLTGALARRGIAGRDGAVLLTSRVSLELVQKTARLGAALLLAVSAPTALAVRTAEAAGITLVAVARGTDFEVYTHVHRIVEDPLHNEADAPASCGPAANAPGVSNAQNLASPLVERDRRRR